MENAMNITDSAVLAALQSADVYQVDQGPLLDCFDLDEGDRTVSFSWVEHDGEFKETISLDTLAKSVVDPVRGSVTTTNVDGEPVIVSLYSLSVPRMLSTAPFS